MRLRPWRHWNYETIVCGFRGHVTPAEAVARLRQKDSGLGVDLSGGRRLARCLRCDAWIHTRVPEEPPLDTLPDLTRLDVPRRGTPLRDAIVLRLIAIDRGIHAVLFGALAAVLIWLDIRLDALRPQAASLLRSINEALSNTGPASSRSFLVKQLDRFLHLRRGTITILAATAVAYCVVEGVEAVGLWLERRWAEYLTAIATAGFLPFEVEELLKRITVFRIGALVVNVAILIYLVWKKRLFGVRGGPQAEEELDREALFGPPG
jgi:uncharacterized membrane protein (DUF2068 family)